MARPWLASIQATLAVAGVFVLVYALQRAVPFTPTQVAALHAARGIASGVVVFLVLWRSLATQRAKREAAEKEHRRTQLLLETVLRQLPVGVYISDAEGRPTFVNDRGAELLGKGVVPGATATDLSEVYAVYQRGTMDPYPSERLPVMRVLSGERRVVADDLDIRRPDRTVPVQVWAEGVKEDGRTVVAVAVFEDVTERIERQRRERELVQVRELGSLRRRFINLAAHELYTPLTPLRLQLKALLKAPDPANVTRQADVLRRNVDRIHHVVGRLLRVTQLEAEAEQVRRTPFDAGELAKDVVAELAPRALEAGIHLTTDIRPANVLGDAPKLRDAMFNLAENAVKFGHEGVTVKVALRATDEAVFEVVDDGPGFEGDPKLFEPFHRVLGEEGRTREGWGLGLHITKVIVTAHGGRVWVDSGGPGQGTTAGFALPLAP